MVGEVRIVDVSASDAPEQLDRSFREAGFAVIVGHGVDPSVLERARALALEWLRLPDEVKAAHRSPALGVPGWSPYGSEANGYLVGEDTPPDYKETFIVSPEVLGDGRPAHPNVWPTEVPGLRDAVAAAYAALERVHLQVLGLAGLALDLDDPAYFVDRARQAETVLYFNRYPPPSGHQAGQYRIGPHTDFGSVTVLDRQPGSGGLQVEVAPGEWVDAPHVPGSLTINVADLLQLWTGGRWRSSSHRVVLPDADHQDEDLLSLVYFCEPDADVLVGPVIPGDDFVPVRAGDYLADRIAAITV